MYFQCSILNHRARPVIGFLMQQIPQWQTWKTHMASKQSKQNLGTNTSEQIWRFAAWLTSHIFVPEAETHRGRDFNEVFQEKHGPSHVFFNAPKRPHGRFAHLSLSPSDLPRALAWVSVVFNWIKWRPKTGASSYLSTTELGRGKQRVWTMVVFQKNKKKTDRVNWGKLIKMIFWKLH